MSFDRSVSRVATVRALLACDLYLSFTRAPLSVALPVQVPAGAGAAADKGQGAISMIGMYRTKHAGRASCREAPAFQQPNGGWQRLRLRAAVGCSVSALCKPPHARSPPSRSSPHRTSTSPSSRLATVSTGCRRSASWPRRPASGAAARPPRGACSVNGRCRVWWASLAVGLSPCLSLAAVSTLCCVGQACRVACSHH